VTRYLAALKKAYPPAHAALAPNGAVLPNEAPDMDCAVALYAAHDGQGPDGQFPPNVWDGFRWLNVRGIASTREMLDGMVKKGEWDDKTTKLVDHWAPGWIPILSNGCGDHVVIDSAGTFTGKRGQIIQFRHDDGFRPVIAPSFDAWFAVWVESLEAGMWTIDAGMASLWNTEASTALFAQRMPGYPLGHKVKRIPR